MTHIIIHNSQTARHEYLLTLVSKLLQGKFEELDQLHGNPDIHWTQTQKDSIGIEDVKRLQKEMIFQPFQEIAQIGIIDNAHELTVEAQNALLKTLEEQPGSTEYVLLTNNEKNLLPTIISRGVKHYVKTGTTETKKIGRPNILEMDLVERFAQVEELVKKGEFNIVIEQLLGYFGDQMRVAIKKSENEKVGQYKKGIEDVMTAQTRLKANGNKKLVLENMLLRLGDI